MKKIIFLVLTALLLVCASAGCITAEESVSPDKYFQNHDDGTYYVYVYIDEHTGVEYLIYREVLLDCGGITPRYNADGTLKINEEFRK